MAPEKSKGSKRRNEAPVSGHPRYQKSDPVRDPFNVRDVLEQNHVSTEEYEERFFWNDGGMKFSTVRIVPTREEIEHARKIVAKIEKKCSLS